MVAKCVILCEVLSFRMLLLEGQDGRTWKDHVCNHMTYWWPSLFIFHNCFGMIMLYVMWRIYRGYHYVNLWLVFERSTYGIYHIPPLEDLLVKKWFYPWCIEYIEVSYFKYLDRKSIPSFFSWWFIFGWKFTGIIIQRSTIGLTFAYDLLILSP